MNNFTLTSNNFKEGDILGHEFVLSKDYGYGCEGGNRSPHLAWTEPPEGTESFTLTMFDPDAPTGSGFWHWVVVNIPKDVRELDYEAGNPECGRLPTSAMHTRSDFSTPGYGGPCSPIGHGRHRYDFMLHAVGLEKLPVNEDASAAVVGFHLNFNSLGKATLTGFFER